MTRARERQRCGGFARGKGQRCSAPAVFAGLCRIHGAAVSRARAPWTLTATSEGLGCFKAHERYREPLERRETRPIRPVMAEALIRRGVITGGLFLAGTTRHERFLRRLERAGIAVIAEGGEHVRRYRFEVPVSATESR